MLYKSLHWFTARPTRLAATTLFAGAAASLLVFLGAQGWEARRIREDFQRHADNRISALQLTIRERFHDAEMVASVMEAFDAFEPSTFKEAAKKVVESTSTVEAVEWIPLVSGARRTEFEKAAQSRVFKSLDGKNALEEFTITEPGANGNILPAGTRETHYPIYLREPCEGREMLGLDLGANEAIRRALADAFASGRAAVTPLFDLSRRPQGNSGVRLLVPVWQRAESQTVLPASDLSQPRGLVSVWWCESMNW